MTSTISQPHFLEKWDVTGFCATSGQIVCARVTFIALWVRELKRKKSELERERERVENTSSEKCPTIIIIPNDALKISELTALLH